MMSTKKYVLILIGFACALSSLSQAAPKPDAGTQKIVFQREGGFHVMNPDGSAQKMLPKNKLYVSQVLSYSNNTSGYRILSPDGKFILSLDSEWPKNTGEFISVEGVSNATINYLDLKVVKTGKKKHLLQLAGVAISDFVVSPDSKRIAYITRNTDNQGYSTNLQIMDVYGRNNKSLAATTEYKYEFYDEEIMFSPDGKTLTFERVDQNSGSYKSKLYSINTDGSKLSLLKNQFYRFHPNKDGGKVTFAISGEIFITEVDAINPRQLTDNKANDFNPVFSPDGKQITFVSDRDGNNEIYLMNADGSGQKRLTKNKLDDNFPQWRTEQNIQ